MATITKQIVCLANSRKLSGRCIAGRELSSAQAGAWIRPVSDREHQEVSEHERQYKDGSDPRVLDIINIPLIEPRPKDYQWENWLLDPGYYWVKVGRVTWKDLRKQLNPIGQLWFNGHHTYHGINDKVPLNLAEELIDSLRLIRVNHVRLSVLNPGKSFGNSKRRVLARFNHADVDYALWVTDPDYERRYLAMSDGDYDIDQCYLTISLGEPYNDCCYKLVAAIIERNNG